MNIVVWYWGRRGGGAQYASRMVERLVANGHHVVAHLAEDNPDRPAAGEVHRVRVHSIRDLARTTRSREASVAAAARRAAADAIVIPMVSPQQMASWPAARRSGVPIVAVVHDPAPHLGDRHLPMDVSVGWIARHADAVVAPSAHSARILSERLGRPVSDVGLGPLLPCPMGPAPSRGSSLLVPGRLLPYKGLDLLADALGLLSPELRPDIRVIGSSHKRVAPSLARLVEMGATLVDAWLDDSAFAEEIGSARAVLLPYREASQSGLVPTALAFGTPVIATDVGALREQIGTQIGTRGLAVSATPDALASALEPASLAALRPGDVDRSAWVGDQRLDHVLADVVSLTGTRRHSERR